MRLSLTASALLSLALAGCVHKPRPQLPDVVIPIESLTGPVVLHNCTDLQVSPPKCGRASIRYKKGAEQIQAPTVMQEQPADKQPDGKKWVPISTGGAVSVDDSQ